MSDLDRTVRAAIDAAAARAVAPPFAVVERRRARRRVQRAVLAAAAVVTAFGATAVAVPRLRDATPSPAASGGLKWWYTLTEHQDDLGAVRECVASHYVLDGGPWGWYTVSQEHVERCYAESGYGPPPVPQDRVYKCDPPPAATPVVTIASGDAGGIGWSVFAWQGDAGTRCMRSDTDERSKHSYAEDDRGPVGALHNGLLYRPLDEDGSDVWMLVWGAVEPGVARIRFTTTKGFRDVATVVLPDAPDRAHFGTAFPVGGPEEPFTAKYYDASGREIGRYP